MIELMWICVAAFVGAYAGQTIATYRAHRLSRKHMRDLAKRVKDSKDEMSQWLIYGPPKEPKDE